MDPIDYRLIGQKIRRARQDLHLSQEQLAETCDLSASFLGHIERGTRKMSLETFAALCTALRLAPNYLLAAQSSDSTDTYTIDLDALATDDPAKKQRFINAVNALAAGIDQL